MNKVTTINLNGNAYQLEEAGYTALSAYLAGARTRLSDNPDQEEIVRDLEQAIADKLSRYLSAHKSVVSAEEVETVLKEMGPVDGGTESSHSVPPAGPKRLYRIPEGEYIAGVATGLSAYLNLDVKIIRIIMVGLLILTSGGFFFAYLLAWIFIPAAQTQEEHAKAYGAAFNAEELIARTKEKYSKINQAHAEGMKQWQYWKQERRAQKRAYKQAYKWNRPYRRSAIHELIMLTLFIFAAWVAYHNVPLIHQFFDSVWNFVHVVSARIAEGVVEK